MAPTSKAKGKAKAADSDSGTKLKPAQSINVRHILCEKYSKKEEALAKLRNGAKFDEVAREYSEDKARQGGSLGWKTRGSLHGVSDHKEKHNSKTQSLALTQEKDFEKVAYELQPGSIGEVKTSHGYHIILVEGRK
ncbi:hypothetical protein DV738_g1012, partial [Chaetothyriales sp. CBS 135597]